MDKPAIKHDLRRHRAESVLWHHYHDDLSLANAWRKATDSPGVDSKKAAQLAKSDIAWYEMHFPMALPLSLHLQGMGTSELAKNLICIATKANLPARRDGKITDSGFPDYAIRLKSLDILAKLAGHTGTADRVAATMARDVTRGDTAKEELESQREIEAPEKVDEGTWSEAYLETVNAAEDVR